MLQACQPLMTSVTFGYSMFNFPFYLDKDKWGNFKMTSSTLRWKIFRCIQICHIIRYIAFVVFTLWQWFRDPDSNELGIVRICLHLAFFLITGSCHSILADPWQVLWSLKQCFLMFEIADTINGRVRTHWKYSLAKIVGNGMLLIATLGTISLVAYGCLAAYFELPMFKYFPPTVFGMSRWTLFCLFYAYDWTSLFLLGFLVFLYVDVMIILLNTAATKFTSVDSKYKKDVIFHFYRWAQLMHIHSEYPWEIRTPFLFFGGIILQVTTLLLIIRLHSPIYVIFRIVLVIFLIIVSVQIGGAMMVSAAFIRKSETIVHLLDPTLYRVGKLYRQKRRLGTGTIPFYTPLRLRVGGFFDLTILTFPLIIQSQVIPWLMTLTLYLRKFSK